MKKVVVTGANGFVGRYLVDELLQKGYEVWAIIRDETEDVSFWEGSGPHIVYCDLANILTLPEKIETDVTGSCFYHLAWAGSSGDARRDYELQLQNALACANAAKAAKRLGCGRFIGAGSITELVYRDYLYQDGTKPEMTACYAIGKMTAEYLTRCVCAEEGLEYIWTYIANFYGVRDQTDNFINSLIKNYLTGKAPNLTPGEQLTDFTYVSDIAGGMIAVGECGKAGNVYYVGFGKPRPLREFVLTVRNILAPELDSGLGRKELYALPINYEMIDLNKLHRETGYKPTIAFSEGIKLTTEWIKAQNKKETIL